MNLGSFQQAVASYRQALAAAPQLSYIHSNLLFALNYVPGLPQQENYRESLLWEQRHARPLFPQRSAWRNSPEPERKLRIGYVSPDFLHSPPPRPVAGAPRSL